MENHVTSPAGLRVNTLVLAFTLVAGLVVFLRLFTRLFLTKGAGIEDICIVLAMGLSIALAVMTSEQVTHGLGQHYSDLNSNDLLVVLKAFWASFWIYSLAIMMINVSALVQYLRIFPIRRFRATCYVVLGIAVAYGSWSVFGNIVLCTPISFFWDKSMDGHCINQGVVWFTNAGVNITLDIVILILPLYVVRTLQIPSSQKKGLVGMFALSISVVIVSVIRLYYLTDIADSHDLPFDNVTHATLSGIEVNVGIICACLPAMRPLLALMLPNYFTAAVQYQDAPGFDIEQPKYLQVQSARSRPGTAKTYNTSQAPLPGHSRKASGSVRQHSRPATPGRTASVAHSRKGSETLSLNTVTRLPTQRPEDDVPHPLRLSPITPFSPFPLPTAAHRHSRSYADPRSAQAVDSRVHSRRPSDASVGGTRPSSRRRPQTPVLKPLPITPFPVG